MYNTTLKTQVEEVIKHSQGIEKPKVDELMKNWYSGKKHFIDKWGDMTKEIEGISMSVDSSEKSDNKKGLAYLLKYTLGEEAYQFILDQEADAIYENRVEKEFVTEKGRKIPKGMKISKSLKFFSEDKNALKEAQTKLSKIIQDGKLTGTLVMSVDPLDFLSISDNAHCWRSCHAMNGEYRAGNLSYMQDSHTFICYLKSEKDQKIENFPFAWNSKKWRVLMFMRKDNKILMSGKHYPFEHKELLNKSFELIESAYPEVEWNDGWSKPPMECVRVMMEDALGSLQYNDCLISTSYRPMIRYSKDIQNTLPNEFSDKSNTMIIGEAIECLGCAKGMVSLSSSLLCDVCGNYTYCDCCGQAEREEDLWALGSELLCQECYEDNGIYCERCDLTVDSRTHTLNWNSEDEVYYCDECEKEIAAEAPCEEEEDWRGEI